MKYKFLWVELHKNERDDRAFSVFFVHIVFYLFWRYYYCLGKIIIRIRDTEWWSFGFEFLRTFVCVEVGGDDRSFGFSHE